MQKLHWTYLLVAFFLIAVTGCQKMEEIEPIMDQATPSERGIYAGEDDLDTDDTSVDWNSNRSGVERPDDTLDNVNDDDDEEEDDEEQSLVLN